MNFKVQGVNNGTVIFFFTSLKRFKNEIAAVTSTNLPKEIMVSIWFYMIFNAAELHAAVYFVGFYYSVLYHKKICFCALNLISICQMQM